ncbi:hypothetical protein SOVF_069340 [Spinacia oleracea]|nr:hypothetical protein SOVF_069340 [Spinacia oleracea]
MVMTLRKRVPPISPQSESEHDSESEPEISPKRAKTQKNPNPIKKTETLSSSESESESDSEKENEGVPRKKPAPQKKKRYPPLYPRVRDRSYDAARRSDRLKDVQRAHIMETERSLKDMGIWIPEEWKTEIYTEEDEKLLGDCETKWTLKVDGVDEDGDRLYNPDGTPCHQCRQKVHGKLTYCSKCRSPLGKICGDCLYTRYGENVLEAVENPTWSCPSCRGICNCSRCRRTKGWDPINIQHSKVIESGFKSVAHYLILTRRAGATKKELNDGAVVLDLTAEEKTAAPQPDEGSDYSAESSESESDDSDSEDESKGEKTKKEQPVESQVDTTEVSNEEAADMVQKIN